VLQRHLSLGQGTLAISVDRGNITVRLTSSLTALKTGLIGLKMYFALMFSMCLSSFDEISKPVKEEVSRTVILSPQEASEHNFVCGLGLVLAV